MTIKERIMALFNKPVEVDKEIEIDEEIDDDIKEELKLWESVEDDFTLLEEAKEIVLSEKPTRLEAMFESEFPGKHAIWRGNETKAFLRWKEELG